jgi:hypothetical protein
MRFESQRKRTCGLPFRGRPKHTYLVTSRDFVGEEIRLVQPAQGHEVHYSYRSRFKASKRQLSAVFMSQLLKFEMKTGSSFGAPGRTPRELARSGSWALTPNRRPSSRRASTKEQGKYWHDTYTVHTAEPRGGPGGCW